MLGFAVQQAAVSSEAGHDERHDLLARKEMQINGLRLHLQERDRQIKQLMSSIEALNRKLALATAHAEALEASFKLASDPQRDSGGSCASGDQLKSAYLQTYRKKARELGITSTSKPDWPNWGVRVFSCRTDTPRPRSRCGARHRRCRPLRCLAAWPPAIA